MIYNGLMKSRLHTPTDSCDTYEDDALGILGKEPGAARSNPTVSGATCEAPNAPHEARVSFVAVGDNIIHTPLYRSYALPQGGYDFSAAYERLKPLVRQADIAFLNQESVCGGSSFGLSDFPQFNSPSQVLDAVAEAGFTWINTATNHSLDRGPAPLLAQHARIANDARMIQTGTNATEAGISTPTVFPVQGLRVGLASYTYGLNASTALKGREYLVNCYSEERLARDIAALQEVSDVQVVGMHWGEEYAHEPSAEQRTYAQLLADLGVNVVIGTHPHVLQPACWLIGKGGNKTLVLYSLGNVLSAQTEPARMLGALARFTLRCRPGRCPAGDKPGAPAICDVSLLPLVTHIDSNGGGHRVYLLSEYPDELAAQHQLASKGFCKDALRQLAHTVLGDELAMPL